MTAPALPRQEIDEPGRRRAPGRSGLPTSPGREAVDAFLVDAYRRASGRQ